MIKESMQQGDTIITKALKTENKALKYVKYILIEQKGKKKNPQLQLKTSTSFSKKLKEQ
jgi:hypothetical protein